MNLIQKMHALMVSDKINIWHYPAKQDGPKFYYWITKDPENQQGVGYYTLDAMIEAAYKHIDPLLQPLPTELPEPPHAEITEPDLAISPS